MIQQVKSLRLRYQKMLNSFTEVDLRAWFAEFFALYPFITKVEWEQYTPHFNDGSPCVFEVYEPSLTLTDAFLQEHDLPHEDGVMCSWQFNKKHAVHAPALAEAIDQLGELFQEEDLLKTVLGDHSEISVDKNYLTREECVHE